jgi:hypothetical protein
MAWWRWMAREEVGEVAAGMADTTTVAGIGMRGYYRWNGDWRWWGGGWNPWWVIPVPVPYPYYGGTTVQAIRFEKAFRAAFEAGIASDLDVEKAWKKFQKA